MSKCDYFMERMGKCMYVMLSHVSSVFVLMWDVYFCGTSSSFSYELLTKKNYIFISIISISVLRPKPVP